MKEEIYLKQMLLKVLNDPQNPDGKAQVIAKK